MRVRWHACGSQRTPLGVGTFLPLSFRDPAMFFTCWTILLAPTFTFLKYTVKIISENIFRLSTWSDWIWHDTSLFIYFFTLRVCVCAHVLVRVWCALCTCGSYFSLPCGWVLGIDQVGSAFAFTSYTILPSHPSLLTWVWISPSWSGWLPSHLLPVSASWIVGIEQIALCSKFCFSSCLFSDSVT